GVVRFIKFSYFSIVTVPVKSVPQEEAKPLAFVHIAILCDFEVTVPVTLTSTVGPKGPKAVLPMTILGCLLFLSVGMEMVPCTVRGRGPPAGTVTSSIE